MVRLSRANLNWNYPGVFLFDYRAPLENRAGAPLAERLIDAVSDQSVAVAPPGRYPLGAGRFGHRDLLGNVMEVTAIAGTPTNTTSYPWTRNGSFETSHQNATTQIGNTYSFNGLTKYGRMGARCARPTAVYPATALPEAAP